MWTRSDSLPRSDSLLLLCGPLCGHCVFPFDTWVPTPCVTFWHTSDTCLFAPPSVPHIAGRVLFKHYGLDCKTLSTGSSQNCDPVLQMWLRCPASSSFSHVWKPSLDRGFINLFEEWKEPQICAKKNRSSFFRNCLLHLLVFEKSGEHSAIQALQTSLAV